MARDPQLNWDPERGSWRVRYKGRSCRFDGGSGKSDREAKKKAKEDWTVTRADIDRENADLAMTCLPDYEDCIRGWQAVQEHGRSVDDQTLVESAKEEIDGLQAELDKDQPRVLSSEDFHPATLPREQHEEDGFCSYFLYGANSKEEAQAKDYFWREALMKARRRLDTGCSTAEVRKRRESLSYNVDNFLIQKRRQVEIGDLSATRADMLARHLAIVTTHFGEEFDVTKIDGQSLIDFRHHCLTLIKKNRVVASTSRDIFAAFKQLIKWMHSTAETIGHLPRNFDDKSLAIHVPDTVPDILTIDQISELVEDSSPRTELYILLGLNCGYRQTDIACIAPGEVDWSAGKITRKRTKTAKSKRTPTVTYKLWPRTFELLKKQGTRNGERVLLSVNGTPLVNVELRNDGKTRKTDAIKSAMQRLTKKKDFAATMDILRNTSATMLRSSSVYTTLVDLFLGHSPRSMADKHYAAAPIGLLEEATDWLASQYGFDGGQNTG